MGLVEWEWEDFYVNAADYYLISQNLENREMLFLRGKYILVNVQVKGTELVISK